MSPSNNMKKESQHTHGFKTPGDYFDSLEQDLWLKAKISELPEQTGFSIPEDYFETLESKIFKDLKEEPKSVPVISIFRKKELHYLAGIAASLVMGFFIWNSMDPPSTIDSFEASTYIENGGVNINTYDLAQLLSEEDITQIVQQNQFFSEESLDHYLLENLDESILLQE